MEVVLAATKQKTPGVFSAAGAWRELHSDQYQCIRVRKSSIGTLDGNEEVEVEFNGDSILFIGTVVLCQ